MGRIHAGEVHEGLRPTGQTPQRSRGGMPETMSDELTTTLIPHSLCTAQGGGGRLMSQSGVKMILGRRGWGERGFSFVLIFHYLK